MEPINQNTFSNQTSCIFSQNQFLKFQLNRDQCLQMIKSVLSELNAHIKEFGDKLLCIVREGTATYAFELTFEFMPNNAVVRVENFRVLNSFSELVELRYQMQKVNCR